MSMNRTCPISAANLVRQTSVRASCANPFFKQAVVACRTSFLLDSISSRFVSSAVLGGDTALSRMNMGIRWIVVSLISELRAPPSISSSVPTLRSMFRRVKAKSFLFSRRNFRPLPSDL